MSNISKIFSKSWLNILLKIWLYTLVWVQSLLILISLVTCILNFKKKLGTQPIYKLEFFFTPQQAISSLVGLTSFQQHWKFIIRTLISRFCFTFLLCLEFHLFSRSPLVKLCRYWKVHKKNLCFLIFSHIATIWIYYLNSIIPPSKLSVIPATVKTY